MTEYLVVSAVAGEARYVPEGIPVLVTGVGKTAAADSADEAALDWPALVDASAKILGEWVTAYVV